jgi:predicted SAM-dependent methyltransferase
MAPDKLNVGCGLHVVPGYLNLDNSPTLRLQRGLPRPVLDQVRQSPVGKWLGPAWPSEVQPWDIRQGLPGEPGTLGVIYSSHMLEHLSRPAAVSFVGACHQALRPGGILRLALPDLERRARGYLKALDAGDSTAADEFLRSLLLAQEDADESLKGIAKRALGRELHHWMYDRLSLTRLLTDAGFTTAEPRAFAQSRIPEIAELELEDRASESVYVEAVR